MDDFRKIHIIESIVEERWAEALLARQAVKEAGAPRFGLRSALVTLTIMLLGMIAWWGH